MRTAMTLWAVLLVSCGTTPPPAASPPRPSARPSPESEPESPPQDPRVLGAGASFGELVASARRLDDGNAPESSEGCLLRGGGGILPFRFAATVAVAVRPLPEASPDLDEALARGASVRTLSRWGQIGTGDRGIALVGFTDSPPHQSTTALVVLLTDQGTYLRRAGGAQPSVDGPMTVPEAIEHVSRELRDSQESLFVTAERGVTVESLRRFLSALPREAHGRVLLSVSLPMGTRLPASAEADAGDTTALCPDGLPPPESGLDEGLLDAVAIRGALPPLQQAARQCYGRTTGRAAAGGRVVLAMRIGPEGSVVHACAQEDQTASASFRTCLVEAASAARFPAPSPTGFIDVALPLHFRPDDSFEQRPLCE